MKKDLDWRFLGLNYNYSIDKKNKICHNLEINSVIMDGQLKSSWIYSKEYFSKETIYEWGNIYMGYLSEIISHCLSKTFKQDFVKYTDKIDKKKIKRHNSEVLLSLQKE